MAGWMFPARNQETGGRSFCCDTSFSYTKITDWIYLFHRDGDHLSADRLVNMKRHHYTLEPNVHFSPDGKWIIFRSNMFGPTNVFAVKL
jgi:oligogalacturonide lyase